MRKIKFRGKLINKYVEEWFYGDLITAINEDGTTDYYIIADEYTSEGNEIEFDTCQSPKVETNTIGQYTGLKDKNGVEIYEGDIVEFYEVGKMWKAKIGYDSGAFTVDFGGSFTFLCGCYTEDSLFEVIGNIYDNKELL